MKGFTTKSTLSVLTMERSFGYRTFVFIKEMSLVEIREKKLFLKLFSMKKPKSLSLERSVFIQRLVPASRRHYEYQ